jgi:hypothetical protein
LLLVTMTQEEEDRKAKERARHGSSRSMKSADDKEAKLRARPSHRGTSKPGAVPETSSARGSEKARRDDQAETGQLPKLHPVLSRQAQPLLILERSAWHRDKERSKRPN